MLTCESDWELQGATTLSLGLPSLPEFGCFPFALYQGDMWMHARYLPRCVTTALIFLGKALLLIRITQHGIRRPAPITGLTETEPLAGSFESHEL
jgi:hypothetical protein